MSHAIERHTTQVGDATLSYLSCGPADGPVVLLLHGIPSSANLWRKVMHGLAATDRRVLAPDLPGYGETVIPEAADHSISGAARLLLDWMKQERLSHLWLVGHDLGGAVAQLMAVEDPERFTRWTLINSPVGDTWPVPIVRLMKMAAKAGLFGTLAPLLPGRDHGRSMLKGGGIHRIDEITDDELEEIFWRKVRDKESRQAFGRHIATLDSSPTEAIESKLPSLGIPAQLIWGTRDTYQTWEEAGTRLQRDLGKPDTTLLGDAAHFVPLDDPTGLLKAMLSWRPGRLAEENEMPETR